jgi:sugar phosphate isomerase/epimerase
MSGTVATARPKLSAFPKAYLDDMVVSGTLSIAGWVKMASTLPIEGLELFPGMIDLKDPARWSEQRRIVEDAGLVVPMLCCSPDFTHPDPAFRAKQIELEKSWIDMAVALGSPFCRILSGQARPGVSRDEGLRYSADAIEACLDYAAAAGVTLNIENHYKDGYWEYPEFAMHMDVFCDLVDLVQSPVLGINFDPSNSIIAGDDPLELLERVKHRVVTMHASDRFLASGTIEDLRKEEGGLGYSKMLSHGEIGKGMNDYDAIFSTLASVGFSGWISIEDGVNGFDELERSADFLVDKIAEYWPLETA